MHAFVVTTLSTTNATFIVCKVTKALASQSQVLGVVTRIGQVKGLNYAMHLHDFNRE